MDITTVGPARTHDSMPGDPTQGWEGSGPTQIKNKASFLAIGYS